MQSASDEAVLDRARQQRRTLISADTDFGTLLARKGAAAPAILAIVGRHRRGAAHPAPPDPTGQVTLQAPASAAAASRRARSTRTPARSHVRIDSCNSHSRLTFAQIADRPVHTASW